jgi:hypothetical protein
MNMQHRRVNGWGRLALLPLLLLAVLLLVLAGSLEFPGTARAQGGTTVTSTITVASTAQLIARTTVQISATVTCALPKGATFLDAGGGVQITQASGRVIVQAGGGFAPVTCDGTAQTFPVFATPPPGSAPFHGGPATAIGSLEVDWYDALGNFHEDGFATSPETISIQG